MVPKGWGLAALGTLIVATTGAVARDLRLGAEAPPADRSQRRVAEAVRGVRTGDTVYVVVAETFPHSVDRVVTSLSAARERATLLGPIYGVRGPFPTTRDNNQEPMFLLDECHEPDSDMCDTTRRVSSLWRTSDVDSFTIYAFRGRERRGRTYRTTSADAFFLSLPAWEKFYYPYLVSVSGAQEADRQRESLRAYIARAGQVKR
jgi:hypothetical protein